MDALTNRWLLLSPSLEKSGTMPLFKRIADYSDKICTNCFFFSLSYLTMMPRMRQALIEFENIEDAVNCVSTTQTSQVYIMDRPVFFNFSTSQEITRYFAMY